MSATLEMLDVNAKSPRFRYIVHFAHLCCHVTRFHGNRCQRTIFEVFAISVFDWDGRLFCRSCFRLEGGIIAVKCLLATQNNVMSFSSD